MGDTDPALIERFAREVHNMCRCEFERDAAACLSRRTTPTAEEARGAYLASRHPCDSCVIGSRRAREDAERRAAEQAQDLGVTHPYPPAARLSPRTPSTMTRATSGRAAAPELRETVSR